MPGQDLAVNRLVLGGNATEFVHDLLGEMIVNLQIDKFGDKARNIFQYSQKRDPAIVSQKMTGGLKLPLHDVFAIKRNRDEDVPNLRRRDRARRAAYMPQAFGCNLLTVFECVCWH